MDDSYVALMPSLAKLTLPKKATAKPPPTMAHTRGVYHRLLPQRPVAYPLATAECKLARYGSGTDERIAPPGQAYRCSTRTGHKSRELHSRLMELTQPASARITCKNIWKNSRGQRWIILTANCSSPLMNVGTVEHA